VAVGMLFVWAITYACTWQTLAFIAPAEIPTQKLRSKTSGLAYFTQQTGGLIITFISPYMQNANYGNMGPYIGFFFGSFSFLGIIFVFFCYPETKGASIEDLDMFFEQRLSTREFGKALRGNHGIQEFVLEGHGVHKDVEMANRQSEEKKGGDVNVMSQNS
jgi:SP family sugar:H+ symporter-like MFS transporter